LSLKLVFFKNETIFEDLLSSKSISSVHTKLSLSIAATEKLDGTNYTWKIFNLENKKAASFFTDDLCLQH